MKPAEKMTGQELPGGWIVGDRIERPAGATGGRFSIGYLVVGLEGEKAFLKALDLSEALATPDPTRMLQFLTEAYNFERDLLSECQRKRMSHVATAIADGTLTLPGELIPVPYLVFDLADGDIRTHPRISEAFDLAWVIRALHHITVGLSQLHTHGIAHQDLKPSNVLVFNNSISKLSDLGRADRQNIESPFSKLSVAGDKTYAPPELLYSELDPDWRRRRLGCDAYLLGNMISFLFCGTSVTALIQANLHETHRWRRWKGDYRSVLPYVRNAFGKALEEIASTIPNEIRDEIVKAILEFRTPDMP